MRVFHIAADRLQELQALPQALPAEGFVWIGTGRRQFEVHLAEIQAALQRWVGAPLVDLHISDLLNTQLPSQFGDTSWYDLMVVRRLAAGSGSQGLFLGSENGTLASSHQALDAIDTSPIGFAVFDRVLLSVHPTDCLVREHFASRLAQHAQESDLRGSARLPTSAAELMLRMVNHVVDNYLDLRRLLTRHFATLQTELLARRQRSVDWSLIVRSRDALHMLEDVCEDQRSAVQEWIDALDEWPAATDAATRRERDLLRVRSRDVLEHIERVLTHVRRLEQSAEAGLQMHFALVGQRTNDIMRTLTVITALFLPMNLITGFFGMNFDGLPLIHSHTGVWIAAGMMGVIALVLGVFFWQRRLLGSSRG